MPSREGKTEAPTQKKKKDSRKKGGRPTSADLSGWATLLACTYAVPATIQSVQKVVIRCFIDVGNMAKHPEASMVAPALGEALQGALFAVMPLLLIFLLVGTLTHMAQTGLVITLHPLKPDFKRVNPIQGIKKLFSMKSIWETVKQVAKALAIAAVAKPHIESIAARLTEHGRIALSSGISASVSELIALIRGVCWIVLLIALVDYAYQRRSHMKDLKMTKQEVRDEMRSSEGDPAVKQRIRAMQNALATNRMMSEIGSATVIVTNPTHIAVAIRYEVGAGGAPKIIAIGVDALAARIRERAHDAGVPIVESVPLARALWRACDVGDEIPYVLYEAVAKVLAFVRRLRGGVLAASALPLPRNYDVERATLDAIPGRPGRKNRRQLVA
jgi:flagellar biosynthetic protein FlhB